MGAKTAKTSDRRIRRTQRALRDALLALTAERGWGDFTVRDLCCRADVGRSTFYLHFADKEDVLTGGFEAFRRALQQQVASRDPPLAFARGVIEHAYEQRHAFQALLGDSGGQPVLERFRELLLDLVRHDLARFHASEQKTRAATYFLAGALRELVTSSLESGSAIDAPMLERLFREMAEPILDLLRRPEGGTRKAR